MDIQSLIEKAHLYVKYEKTKKNDHSISRPEININSM